MRPVFSTAEVQRYNKYFACFSRLQEGPGGTFFYSKNSSNPPSVTPTKPPLTGGTSSPPRTFREIYTNTGHPHLDLSMEQYFDQKSAEAARGAGRPRTIIDPASSMETQAKMNQAVKQGRGGIPAPLIGLALGIGAAATAHYFWRRRRSKNGRQVIERVRR